MAKANYTTSVSDKSKRTAFWLCLLGGVGLHYLYVGRIGHGLFRFLLGIALWGGVGILVSEKMDAAIAPLLILIVITLFDLFRISLGRFKDNIGNYLRAK